MKMNNRIILALCFILGTSSLSFGQTPSNLETPTSINDSGADPDASAILDVQSTTKGMLVPRMTTSQRTMINAPANGLLVFDLDTGSFWFFADGNWQDLSSNGGGVGSSIADADQDTKIQVEEIADEDVIRFDVGGTERLTLSTNFSNEINLNFPNNNDNIFLGTNVGFSNTTGIFNTFVGHFAGSANTEGGFNTFIGRASGLSNTTGIANTFMGVDAGFSNTIGGFNTFLGRSAGFENTTGVENTFIGLSAGFNNTTGSGNVFIGYQAGFNEMGSNKLYISNSNTTSPLLYGEFDNQMLQINGQLNIADEYRFPTTKGTVGQLLQLGSNDDLIWTDFTVLQDLDADTKIQVEEIADEDVIRFDVGGTERLTLSTNFSNEINLNFPNNNNNIFLGTNVGLSNTTGIFNTFVGHFAGSANTEGEFNTFIGRGSGLSNTTGIANTFMGVDAGFSNTIGGFNTFLGRSAGFENTTGVENTFIGRSAGSNNTTGSGNVFIGFSAGRANISRSGNVFIGYNSGLVNTSGQNNVFLGTATGLVNTTGSNNTFIGDESGKGNTVGVSNTFLGLESGFENTSGSFNTFLGGLSGKDNTTGNKNTFLGYGAGLNHNTGEGNTFVGYWTGLNNSSGDFNTMIGDQAGRGNTGSRNTFVGDRTGFSNTSGTRNVFIGHLAGSNETGSNRLYIEVNNSSFPLIYGKFDTDSLQINGDLSAERANISNSLTRTFSIGGARSASGSPYANLDFNNFDDNTTPDPTEYTGARISSHNTNSDGEGDLRFHTNNGSNLGVRMTIQEDGNVDIVNNLSKGGGSFKIDHPLDPENKYLYHSFVESPDMMNVYNGNVVLDENGEAVVQMEDWFEPLNRDFRYQLTCIGGFAPVFIAEELKGNQFKIAGGTPGMKISWMVTGIRQDPYANQNRIEVEVEKEQQKRGTYLHPEAYDRLKTQREEKDSSKK